MKNYEKNRKTGVMNKLKTVLALGLSASILFPGKIAANTDGVLRIGDSGDLVEELQRTLRVLDSYDYPEQNPGYFGNDTKNALMNFQRSHGLAVSGIADENTMFEIDRALESIYPEIIYRRDMKPDAIGEDVAALQQILKTMGYYGSAVDGVFKSNTASAVRTFQFDYGMTVDGIVTRRMVEKLNSISDAARPMGEQKEAADISEKIIEPKESRVYTQHTAPIKMQWSTVDSMWKQNESIKVTDIKSGKSFMLKRTGGINHLDAEPATDEDTNQMIEAFGGWSWARRPVVAEISYFTVAASISLMPHGAKKVFGNNAEGHFCIYFTESMSDDIVPAEDVKHIKAIDEAAMKV